MIDYKITKLIKHDDGSAEVSIKVYRGSVTTENELSGLEVKPVTRYRRTQMVGEKIFTVPIGVSIEDLREMLNEKVSQRGEEMIPGQRKVKDSSKLNDTTPR